MKFLFIGLMISVVVLIGVAVAAFWRVRRHMKQSASDTMLRQALSDVEEEQERAKRQA